MDYRTNTLIPIILIQLIFLSFLVQAQTTTGSFTITSKAVENTNQGNQTNETNQINATNQDVQENPIIIFFKKILDWFKSM